MNFPKIILFTSMVLLFTACNSSSNNTSQIDNLALADGKNAYGYFGSNVIFGSTKIVGVWEVNSTHTPDEIITFLDNGETEYAKYGVSLDGNMLTVFNNSPLIDNNGNVMTNTTKEIFSITAPLENDCYKVTLKWTHTDTYQTETIEYYNLMMCKLEDL